MGLHYYNGYCRRDYTPHTYFVEYTVSDGTPRTADYREEGEARAFIATLANPAMNGGCTFVRFYRLYRRRQVEMQP